MSRAGKNREPKGGWEQPAGGGRAAGGSFERIGYLVSNDPAVMVWFPPASPIVIRWEPVTAPPVGFPDGKIEIAGYQIIVVSRRSFE